MDGYRPETYGDAFADVYDDWYRDLHDVGAVVDRVSSVAAGGRVLELGVGTGRLAGPLAAAGLWVVGVDVSSPMLRRLAERRNESGGSLDAVRADMAVLPFAPHRFDVVLIAYNTLFNLPDTASQQRCLHDVAQCLHTDGALIVEAFVPRTDDPPTDALTVRHVTSDSVVLTASLLDPATQVIEGQHIEVREAGLRLRPWRVHYLHPDQLDALALEAGLHLERRAAGWHDELVDADSATHVSTYRPVR